VRFRCGTTRNVDYCSCYTLLYPDDLAKCSYGASTPALIYLVFPVHDQERQSARNTRQLAQAYSYHPCTGAGDTGVTCPLHCRQRWLPLPQLPSIRINIYTLQMHGSCVLTCCIALFVYSSRRAHSCSVISNFSSAIVSVS
jgi:hypothetical protein